MRYVAAYLLKAIANEDGSTPTEKDVRDILEAGGLKQNWKIINLVRMFVEAVKFGFIRIVFLFLQKSEIYNFVGVKKFKSILSFWNY